jgi:hypothetical protein
MREAAEPYGWQFELRQLRGVGPSSSEAFRGAYMARTSRNHRDRERYRCSHVGGLLIV